MKGRIGQIVLVLTAGILFPYMAVLLAMQNGIYAAGQEWKMERKIVTEGGRFIESEQYLAGILAKQIPADYPMETLKAQAVLARTWLYQAMGDADSINEEELGAYRWDGRWMADTYGEDYLKDYQKYYQAVFATRGETAWYEDSRITPLYHALSAGQTRNDSSGICPYLIGRECNFDMEAERFLQVRILEKEEFWSALNRINPLRQVNEGEASLEMIEWNIDTAGYVVTANIQGMEFSAQEIQEVLEISSPWIRIDMYGAQIRIISRGIGHGYGLSQWEARRLAENGYDYKKILQYFFYGISIKTE